jgi:hypothetical protein
VIEACGISIPGVHVDLGMALITRIPLFLAEDADIRIGVEAGGALKVPPAWRSVCCGGWDIMAEQEKTASDVQSLSAAPPIANIGVAGCGAC